MLEFEKKHKRGTKTFLYTLLVHNWILIIAGIVLIYLSWSIYFGSLKTFTENFLYDHKDWYISNKMLSEWILLLGFSFFIIAYLRASIFYQHYKFILDEYAVHLHKGIFFIRETTIPYAQISNVHIMRPYHYRILGISQLDVVTAADKGLENIEKHTKKFFIPIIDTKIARVLARQLLECAEKSRKGQSIYPDQKETEDYEEELSEDEESESTN